MRSCPQNVRAKICSYEGLLNSLATSEWGLTPYALKPQVPRSREGSSWANWSSCPLPEQPSVRQPRGISLSGTREQSFPLPRRVVPGGQPAYLWVSHLQLECPSRSSPKRDQGLQGSGCPMPAYKRLTWVGWGGVYLLNAQVQGPILRDCDSAALGKCTLTALPTPQVL